MIQHTSSGYINKEIFLRWIEQVLIPEVERRRVELDMPEQQSFLVMYNYSSHTDDDVRGVLAEHNIVPVFIPPHGSHIFQLLDRSDFASLKAHIRSVPPMETDK